MTRPAAIVKFFSSKKIFLAAGSILRPGSGVDVAVSGQFLQEECHWILSPPPHRTLRLTVDTSNIKNGE